MPRVSLMANAAIWTARGCACIAVCTLQFQALRRYVTGHQSRIVGAFSGPSFLGPSYARFQSVTERKGRTDRSVVRVKEVRVCDCFRQFRGGGVWRPSEVQGQRVTGCTGARHSYRCAPS